MAGFNSSAQLLAKPFLKNLLSLNLSKEFESNIFEIILLSELTERNLKIF